MPKVKEKKTFLIYWKGQLIFYVPTCGLQVFGVGDFAIARYLKFKCKTLFTKKCNDVLFDGHLND